MGGICNLPLPSGTSDVPENQTKEDETECEKIRVHRASVWLGILGVLHLLEKKGSVASRRQVAGILTEAATLVETRARM